MFVNPRSREGQTSSEIVKKWLSERQFKILNPDFDPHKQECNDLIYKYAGELHAVIVGGGDGSVNYCLRSLIKTKVPLLLIPLGTANNLARTLNIPAETIMALDLLEKGEIRQIDVGLINDIPFMNVIGLGLSTQVNRLTRGEHKKIWGVFAFIWMAFKIGLRMKPFRARIVCDGEAKVVRTLQISICNGRNYGSGLVIHKDADLNDQTLHGLSTEIKSFLHLIGLIPSLMWGRYGANQRVTPLIGKEMFIETRKPMHIDVDGDVQTKTPAKITILPQALNIFLPV